MQLNAVKLKVIPLRDNNNSVCFFAGLLAHPITGAILTLPSSQNTNVKTWAAAIVLPVLFASKIPAEICSC